MSIQNSFWLPERPFIYKCATHLLQCILQRQKVVTSHFKWRKSVICPRKPSYQSNKQTRDPHTNKSSALRKGTPTQGREKNPRSCHPFPPWPKCASPAGRPCHVCPLQLHPAQAALLLMELMHIQCLVQRKFSFLQIQKVMCIEGQWYTGPRITHKIFRGRIVEFNFNKKTVEKCFFPL